jgi:predicted metal-dependent hydrolase
MNVQFDSKTSVQVIHSSRRKTALLTVEDGHVQIIIPSTVSEDRVRQIIQKRATWIRQKLHLNSLVKVSKTKEFVNGESFPYLGKNYRLKFVRGGESGVRMKNGFIEVDIPKSGSIAKHQSKIKELIQTWYQSHAEERFLTKADRFMKQMGVSPAKVSVRDFKSRWGSCTVRGDVTFNWRVIMAPNRVIDYVVVHELAHLVAHDHSDKFWKTIRKIIPDYSIDKEWLKIHGKSLFTF